MAYSRSMIPKVRNISFPFSDGFTRDISCFPHGWDVIVGYGIAR